MRIIKIYLLFFFTMLSISCEEVYHEDVTALCFTKSGDFLRLKIEFETTIKDDQIEDEIGMLLDNISLDVIGSRLLVYIVGELSKLTSDQAKLEIENDTFIDNILDHINSLEEADSYHVKNVKIHIRE